MAIAASPRISIAKLRPIALPGVAATLHLISWFPASGAAQAALYLAAPVVLLFALLFGRLYLSAARLGFLGIILAIGGISLVAEWTSALPLNMALALLTNSTIVLLALKFRHATSGYRNLIAFIAWLTIFQVAIATLQFLIANQSVSFQAMDAGDAAVGTLLTHSHLFVVKMLVLLVILAVAAASRINTRLAIIGAITALFGAVLGSALLVTALVMATIVIVIFLAPKRLLPAGIGRIVRKLRIWVISGLPVVALLMLFLQADNVRYMSNTLTKSVSLINVNDSSQAPGKVAGAWLSAELMLTDQKVLALGTGLGHYSSRAALILSGGYLASQPSWVPVSLSDYTADNIFPLWNREVWTQQYKDGVMNQPFFGIQSLMLELGLVGSFLVVVAYFWLWKRVLRNNVTDVNSAAITLTALILLALLPVILLTDNWQEFPHLALVLLVPISMALSLPTRPRQENPSKVAN